MPRAGGSANAMDAIRYDKAGESILATRPRPSRLIQRSDRFPRAFMATLRSENWKEPPGLGHSSDRGSRPTRTTHITSRSP